MRITIETLPTSMPPVNCEYATCKDEAELRFVADSNSYVLCRQHLKSTMEDALDDSD